MSHLRNIPNIFSLLRVLFAIAFPLSPQEYQIFIIVGAMVSEYLDGYLARVFSWKSRLGEVLDPLADKVFFISVGVTWIYQERISWVQFSLLGVREIGLLILVMIMLFKVNLLEIRFYPAEFFGKLTTVSQYLGFICVLIFHEIPLVILPLTALLGLLVTIKYFYLFFKAPNT